MYEYDAQNIIKVKLRLPPHLNSTGCGIHYRSETRMADNNAIPVRKYTYLNWKM